MQFQVPQFIETEDKIIGPLTLKQFMYVGSATGAAILIFFLVDSIALFIMIGGVLEAIALALAFAKPYGRPLPKLVVSAFKFLWNPQVYVWQPEEKKISPQKEMSRSKSGAPGPAILLEEAMRGLSLKSAWQKLQTKSRKPGPQKNKERYEIVQSISGAREIARRVDYK